MQYLVPIFKPNAFRCIEIPKNLSPVTMLATQELAVSKRCKIENDTVRTTALNQFQRNLNKMLNVSLKYCSN